MTLIEPGDGSESGLRTPRSTWSVLGADGKKTSQHFVGDADDALNPLEPEEIFTRPPTLQREFSAWIPPIIVNHPQKPCRGIASRASVLGDGTRAQELALRHPPHRKSACESNRLGLGRCRNGGSRSRPRSAPRRIRSFPRTTAGLRLPIASQTATCARRFCVGCPSRVPTLNCAESRALTNSSSSECQSR